MISNDGTARMVIIPSFCAIWCSTTPPAIGVDARNSRSVVLPTLSIVK